jgi:hypothetical protein
MPTEFRENRAGMLAMLRTPRAVAAMDHIGQLIRIRAEEIAPVDSGAYAFGIESRKGAHGGGFKVEAGIRNGVASVRVINRVRSGPSRRFPNGFGYGAALEYGLTWVDKRTGRTHTIKKQRILGRALDAVNLA